jgi:hypothetical protein
LSSKTCLLDPKYRLTAGVQSLVPQGGLERVNLQVQVGLVLMVLALVVVSCGRWCGWYTCCLTGCCCFSSAPAYTVYPSLVEHLLSSSLNPAATRCWGESVVVLVPSVKWLSQDRYTQLVGLRDLRSQVLVPRRQWVWLERRLNRELEVVICPVDKRQLSVQWTIWSGISLLLLLATGL